MIAIIGLGYVGLATAHFFPAVKKYLVDSNPDIVKQLTEKTHGLLNKHARKLYNVEQITTDIPIASLYILCLPTPLDRSTSQLNVDILDQVIAQIRDFTYAPILVRSTVPIGYCDAKQVHHFPEFLTQDNPFVSADRYILSFKAYADYDLKFPQPVSVVSNKESESIKLYSNAFLSMKLAFYQSLHRHLSVSDIDVKTVIRGVCSDQRIGYSHSKAPWQIAGACLPKDLVSLAQQSNNPLLKMVVQYIK